jgi:Icc-related predicted phosphoesterase
VIRIAAVGDLHFGRDSTGTLRPQLEHLPDQADVLLLTGDLTKWGDPEEAAVLARELGPILVPKITVLGNHDYQSNAQHEVRTALEASGVTVLEGESTTLDVNGTTLGVAGVKGFGGGFPGACATDFGEPEMKAFIRHTRDVACDLQRALEEIRDADLRVALTHYSPVEQTLQGERLEIYPFLGSYLLAEAIDAAGADLALHGHAHAGTEAGVTPGGIAVRNVAQQVIKRAYNVFCLSERTLSTVA